MNYPPLTIYHPLFGHAHGHAIHYPLPTMHWYNGHLLTTDTITLPITDPGLLYGATLFTTLRVWEQSLDHPLSFWAAHCDRLRHSVQQLNWTEPDWHRLNQGATHLAPHYPVLRITIFPDGRDWITGRSLPNNLSQGQQQGISAWVAPKSWGRSLPRHKTGNYLACWLALQTAQAHGHQEAILTDANGRWLETSTGNLWGWYDGCWWTPPLNGDGREESLPAASVESSEMLAIGGEKILSGVARSHLISVMKWHNRKICERPWSADLMTRFETLFYSNSVRHIVAIAQVYENGHILSYQVDHPEIRAISELFRTTAHLDSVRGF